MKSGFDFQNFELLQETAQRRLAFAAQTFATNVEFREVHHQGNKYSQINQPITILQ